MIMTQVAVIACIHLLLFLIFISVSKHFIHTDSMPMPTVLMYAVAAIYLAFTSPTIWLLSFLHSIGIQCPDTITYILIPVNSTISAIILRGAYAGVLKLIKHNVSGETKLG